jgi:hypothetical protein
MEMEWNKETSVCAVLPQAHGVLSVRCVPHVYVRVQCLLACVLSLTTSVSSTMPLSRLRNGSSPPAVCVLRKSVGGGVRCVCGRGALCGSVWYTALQQRQAGVGGSSGMTQPLGWCHNPQAVKRASGVLLPYSVLRTASAASWSSCTSDALNLFLVSTTKPGTEVLGNVTH